MPFWEHGAGAPMVEPVAQTQSDDNMLRTFRPMDRPQAGSEQPLEKAMCASCGDAGVDRRGQPCYCKYKKQLEQNGNGLPSKLTSKSTPSSQVSTVASAVGDYLRQQTRTSSIPRFADASVSVLSDGTHSRKVTTLSERHSEWMRADKEQQKIFECHWKIIAEQMSQISALVDGLAVLRQEVCVLKNENVDRFDVVHATLASCSTVAHHSALHDRLAYIETYIGDSVGRHQQALQNPKMSLEKQQVVSEQSLCSLNERVKFMEALLGDSADKHVKHLTEIDDVRGTLSKINNLVQKDHGASVREQFNIQVRLDRLEQLIGETCSEHSKGFEETNRKLADFNQHRVSLAQRVEYMENVLGDSAERHSGIKVACSHMQVDSPRQQLVGVQTLMSGGQPAREEHHANFVERLAYVERMLRDSAGQQELHMDETHKVFQDLHGRVLGEQSRREEERAGVELRLSYLEKLVGNSAAQHSQDAESVQKALQDLHGRMQSDQGRLHEHHATLSERLARLEKVMGDSADEQEQKVYEVRKAIAECYERIESEGTLRDKHHTTYDQWGSDLQRLSREFQDEQRSSSQSLEATRQALQEVHGCHTTVQDRVECLEKVLGESSNRHDQHAEELREAIRSCYERLEREISARDIHQLNVKEWMSDLDKRTGELQDKQIDTATSHSTVRERVGYLESLFGDSIDKHGQQVVSLHTALQEHSDRLCDFHGKHCNAVEDINLAHARLGELQGRFGSMQDRVDDLEKLIGDSADTAVSHAQGVQKAFEECCERIEAEKSLRDRHNTKYEQLLASMQERVEYLEKVVGDSADKQSHHTENLQKALQDLHGRIQGEQGRLHEHQASFGERLSFLENAIGVSADKHEQQVTEVQRAMRQYQDELDSEKLKREEHHSNFEQWASDMERRANEFHDKHSKSFLLLDAASNALQELHSRHSSMQERVEFLEKMLGDPTGKQLSYAKKFDDTARRSQDYQCQSKLETDQREQSHLSIQERLECLETLVGASSESQANEFQVAMKQLDVRHSTHEQRTEYLEKLVEDLAVNHENHARELENTHKRLVEVKGSLKTDCSALQQHNGTIETRLDYLERMVGESFDKQAKELEEAHVKVADVHGNVVLSRMELEKHHAAVDERLIYIEKGLGDFAANYASRQDHDAIHPRIDELRRNIDQVYNHIQNEAERQSTRHFTMEQRIEFLESKVCDSEGKYARELDMISALTQQQQEIGFRVGAVSRVLHDMEGRSRLDSPETFTIDTSFASTGTTSKVNIGAWGGFASALGNATPRLSSSTPAPTGFGAAVSLFGTPAGGKSKSPLKPPATPVAGATAATTALASEPIASPGFPPRLQS